MCTQYGDARRGEKLLFTVQQQMFHIRGGGSGTSYTRVPSPRAFRTAVVLMGKKIKSLLLSLRVIANSWTRTISSLIKMPAVLGRWCARAHAHEYTRKMCMCVCVSSIHPLRPSSVNRHPLSRIRSPASRTNRKRCLVVLFCSDRSSDAVSIHNMCVIHAVIHAVTYRIYRTNIPSPNVHDMYIYICIDPSSLPEWVVIDYTSGYTRGLVSGIPVRARPRHHRHVVPITASIITYCINIRVQGRSVPTPPYWRGTIVTSAKYIIIIDQRAHYDNISSR